MCRSVIHCELVDLLFSVCVISVQKVLNQSSGIYFRCEEDKKMPAFLQDLLPNIRNARINLDVHYSFVCNWNVYSVYWSSLSTVQWCKSVWSWQHFFHAFASLCQYVNVESIIASKCPPPFFISLKLLFKCLICELSQSCKYIYNILSIYSTIHK